MKLVERTEPLPRSMYLPLFDDRKRIRLLKRCQYPDQAAPAFEMTTHDLDSLPPYHAISYVWGSTLDPMIIYVNGISRLITQNAHLALEQHASRYAEDYIWIDSICINQTNLKEKSAQVAIMGSIYTNASLVCCSVGSHGDGSHLFPRFLSSLEAAHIIPWAFSDSWDTLITLLGDKNLELWFEAFLQFANRVYWSRMWIMQEILTAQTLELLCGSDRFDWMAVKYVANVLNNASQEIEHGYLKPEIPRYLVPIAHAFHRSRMMAVCQFQRERRPMEGRTALTMFRELGCQDARDRIYGLNALVDNPIVPDYEISAYELAKIVIGEWEVPLNRLQPLLQALRVGCSSTEIQELARKKRLHCIRDGASKLRIPSTEDLDTDQNLHQFMLDGSIKRIWQDENGNLAAKMFPSRGMGGPLSPFLHALDRGEDPLLEQFKELLPKRIFFNDSLVALACHGIQPGDLLANIQSSLYTLATTISSELDCQVMLVLRDHGGEVYEIIGFALVMEEFQFQNPDAVQIRSDPTQFETEVAVAWLTIDDAVGLIAQDLDSGVGFVYIDPRARFERLVTPVSETRRWARLKPVEGSSSDGSDDRYDWSAPSKFRGQLLDASPSCVLAAMLDPKAAMLRNEMPIKHQDTHMEHPLRDVEEGRQQETSIRRNTI